MAEQKFSDNLLRVIAAEMHVLNCSQAARDLFGKSYYSLGQTERSIVDKTILELIGGNFQTLTADYLATPKIQEPVGFRAPSEPPKAES